MVFLAIILPYVLLYSLQVNLSLYLTFFFQVSGVALRLCVSFFFYWCYIFSCFSWSCLFGEESLSGILMYAVRRFSAIVFYLLLHKF